MTTVNCDNAPLAVLRLFGLKLRGHLEVYIIKVYLDLQHHLPWGVIREVESMTKKTASTNYKTAPLLQSACKPFSAIIAGLGRI